MKEDGGVVLITSPGFDETDQDTAGRLREFGLEIRHEPFRGQRSPSKLIELLDRTVAAIVSADLLTRAVLSQAKELKVIARTGVGTDSIDLTAAKDFGIAVRTTPDVNSDTVAEHALALILAAVRSIPAHDAAIKSGLWERPGPFPLNQLAGSRVGIIGYGSIGRAVAQRLAGFDADVRICDPYLEKTEGVELDPMDAVLAWSDIVTIHVPLLPSTRHLIGKREFELMAPSTVLVNTSRGDVVNEDLLYRALQTGQLAGAALDVFSSEPPHTLDLVALPNVIATPHIGGLSVRSMHRMLSMCVDGVLTHLSASLP